MLDPNGSCTKRHNARLRSDRHVARVEAQMTPTGNEELVSIQPKHLRLIKAHLSQYLDLLCEQAEAGERVKEIDELGLLDYVIDTLLGAHCNDTEC